MSIRLTEIEERKLELLYVAANIPGVLPEDRRLLEIAVTNPLIITRKGVDYLLTKYKDQVDVIN